MRLSILATAAAILHGAVAANAQTPAFDPQSYKSQVAGPATRVLVLGTPHLNGAPASFKPAYLEPLLTRLAAFQPSVITIEALSGVQCDLLIRNKASWAGVADDY